MLFRPPWVVSSNGESTPPLVGPAWQAGRLGGVGGILLSTFALDRPLLQIGFARPDNNY